MSTVTAVAAPYPLVKATKHPLLWLKNKLFLVVAAAVLAYVGMLAAAGTYYLLFETYQPVTNLWHQLVSNDDLRHNIRNIGEGLYGGLFAQAVVWNHYKKRKLTLNGLDRLEIKLHIANLKDDKPLSFAQLFATPLLVLIYAAPGFLAAYFVVLPVLHSLFHTVHEFYVLFQPVVDANMGTASTGKINQYTGLITQNLDKKLMGYGASLFFARRVVKGVFDDLQLWFVNRRIENNKGQPQHWFPAPYQARFNNIQELVSENPHGSLALNRSRGNTAFTVGIKIGLVAAGLLAILGLYVLTFIAK